MVGSWMSTIDSIAALSKGLSLAVTPRDLFYIKSTTSSLETINIIEQSWIRLLLVVFESTERGVVQVLTIQYTKQKTCLKLD